MKLKHRIFFLLLFFKKYADDSGNNSNSKDLPPCVHKSLTQNSPNSPPIVKLGQFWLLGLVIVKMNKENEMKESDFQERKLREI